MQTGQQPMVVTLRPSGGTCAAVEGLVGAGQNGFALPVMWQADVACANQTLVQLEFKLLAGTKLYAFRLDSDGRGSS